MGARIREARNAKGVTVDALARELGVSARTVAGWQSDRSRPSYETLVELARILDKPVEFFLEPVAEAA